MTVPTNPVEEFAVVGLSAIALVRSCAGFWLMRRRLVGETAVRRNAATPGNIGVSEVVMACYSSFSFAACSPWITFTPCCRVACRSTTTPSPSSRPSGPPS